MANKNLLTIGVIVFVVWFVMNGDFGGSGDDGDTGTSPDTGLCTIDGPDNDAYSAVFNVQNMLNDTGIENFDTTTLWFEAGTNKLKATSTDSIDGAITLEHGKKYAISQQSTSGTSGDVGYFTSAPSSGVVKADGTGEFTACGTGDEFTFGSEQHGLPEVRAFDVLNDGFMFDNQDASAVDYETTDGIQFNSSTQFTTATAVAAGGEFHVKVYVRGVETDENVNDMGTYILVDAVVTTWDTPTVMFDGQVLQDVSGQLTEHETKAYNAYEYVYKIPANRKITKSNEGIIDLSIFALSGQDPSTSTDIALDLAPIGRYSSVREASTHKVGAVNDASSPAQVHTLFDIDFPIS